MILDIGGQALACPVQVGVAQTRNARRRCESARRCADGFIRRRYTAEEVDAIAAYSLEFDRCFLIPIARVENKPAIALRLSPCRNNQRRRINWADDFDFAATIGRHKGP